MNAHLQQALTGAPVTVNLGGKEYPLAFPIEGVILYQEETATLDRSRAKGRDRLTRALKDGLRAERLQLLQSAEKLRPPKGTKKWADDNLARFGDLQDEANTLKVRLDEDAGTGDSLYDLYNWRKISPQGDPQRMILALWVGLHVFQKSKTAGEDDDYVETLTRRQLAKFVHLGNGNALVGAVSKALASYLVDETDEGDDDEEEESPNPQPPEKQPAVIQARPDGAHSPRRGWRNAGRRRGNAPARAARSSRHPPALANRARAPRHERRGIPQDSARQR